jgi:hypothetical protein
VEQRELERLVGSPLRLTLEEIVDHPGLPEARKVYFDHFLRLYDGDPFLVRLLIESGRFLVFHLVALLEAAHDPERRETWPTIGLLKQKMAMFGLASGRHVDHLVGRLAAVKFLRLQPSDRDRRVRIISSTARLQAHNMAWFAAGYAPLAALYPRHDYGSALRADPDYYAFHCRVGARFLPVAAKLMASLPDVMLYFNRPAGSMIVTALLQTAMASPDYPHAAVPYTDIGERFGVSRTHVRNLLVAAADAGLVTLHTRGGLRAEILPRLWTSHDRGLAIAMYLHDATYLAVVNELAGRDVVGSSTRRRTGQQDR